MPDENRLGEDGERNPNEAMEDGGSSQGTAPGTGDAGEGGPASPLVGGDPGTPTAPPPSPPAPGPAGQ